MQRLPLLQPPPATTFGCVYVVQRGKQYKIGFSRNGVARRTKDAEGTLLFVISAGQQPSVLEGIIHKRFKSKRMTDSELYGREWFELDASDLAWLRGLSRFTSNT